MNLFAELSRRNVIRVGIAYIITSWVVSQVAELAADSFEAPAWVMKMFITFLALGFPFALIFAWAFELTPEGLKKEKDVDRAQSITPTTGRKLDFAIIGMLVIALGYFIWESRFSPPVNEANVIPAKAGTHSEISGTTPTRASGEADAGDKLSDTDAAAITAKSIAILPFANRSAGEENTAFFSDGIHDDLLTLLSKIHELKVISRTSVMAYRDTSKNMRQIGEELGVRNLLEGGVQQAGDRVRINVQLINAQTDQHLWAETYDREVTTENIFEIQGEIARAIAVALEATLSSDEDKALGKTPTGNLEAYQAVLISRQLKQRSGFESIIAAVDYAQQAVDLDPGYADAYLALANSLIQGVSTGAFTIEDVGGRITAAIDAAMSLRPDYGPVWSTQGLYQSWTENPHAEQSFEKALRLDPGNTDTLYAYGFMLQRAGRPDPALPLLLKSVERDPLSQNSLFALGRTYSVKGDYEQARTTFARIREIDPSSPLGYASTAGTYYPRGQLARATYWIRQALSIDPQDFELGAWLVFLYDNLDDYPAAQAWLEWLDDWVADEPMPMAMKALHLYLTGEFESAVEITNRALELGLPNRWGSDSIFLRIKRDESLAAGNPEAGAEILSAQHPGLLGPDPEITPDNMLQAVDLAQLLSVAGRAEESERILEAVITAYDEPYFVSGGVRAPLVPAKTEALALLGDGPGALAELRRIIDEGWRLYWRWETELNANFDGIRDTAEFQAMVSELEADMAEQRARAQAMAASGEIEPPPKIEPK
jgi:TolB-like protein/Tfp pilus assembly protein PilF